jgi:hypothetical protein
VNLYLHSPRTLSWRDAQLKQRDTFTLPLLLTTRLSWPQVKMTWVRYPVVSFRAVFSRLLRFPCHRLGLNYRGLIPIRVREESYMTTAFRPDVGAGGEAAGS